MNNVMTALRSNLSSSLLIPLGKTFSRRRYFLAKRYQQELEKSQYQDSTMLEAKQLDNLRKLIRHCYAHVPYYHRLMNKLDIAPEDIRAIKDLSRFPLLTKSVLRKNFDLLRATNRPSETMKLEASGGTTGTPVQFYRDLSSEYKVDAANWRFWKWAGYVPGMKVAKFWGHLDEIRKSKSLYSRLKLFMENTFILNAFDVSDRNMDNYVTSINRLRPEIYHGYASAILNFTRYVRDQRVKIHKPKSIIITADKIYENEKKEISAFFGCNVYEEYGCREFSIIAHECEQHSGLHVADEQFIVESINFENEKSCKGKFGELVITCLSNYSMPLIRYKLGDFGTVLKQKCSCGKGLTLIDFISGRTADFVVTKSGKKIYGPLFVVPFDNVPGISRYLVKQTEPGKIEIKIVVNAQYNESGLKALKSNLENIFSNDLEYTLTTVTRLRPGASGKRRTVISYLNDEDKGV